MACKLKTVVLFLQIATNFLPSRPFGKIIDPLSVAYSATTPPKNENNNNNNRYFKFRCKRFQYSRNVFDRRQVICFVPLPCERL